MRKLDRSDNFLATDSDSKTTTHIQTKKRDLAMSRTLTTIVIATLFSSTLLAQTTSDPVADLTSQIISRYMPRSTASSFSQIATDLEDQTDDQKEPTPKAAGYAAPTATNSFSFAYPSDIPGMSRAATARSLPMMMPRMGAAAMPMFSQAARLPGGLQFAEKVADDEDEAKIATKQTLTRSIAIPRPRSFSAASNNGIHAIQAVVPTDGGDEKVELKGNSDQVRKQLDSLSPEIQRIMRQSLGL